jgi:hypothetical protein
VKSVSVVTSVQTKTVSGHVQTVVVSHSPATTSSATTTTSTHHAAAAAAVGAAAATHQSESSGSGGLPGWAWVLIGVGGAGLVVWAVAVIRRRRGRASHPDETDAPAASNDPSPPSDGSPPA